jgi:hypothetical protein
MNQSDRESELVNFIRSNAPIRTDILLTSYNKSVKKEFRLGLSTLYKRLDDLEQDTVITRIKGKDELKRYGVNDSDGRATYVFIKATVESKQNFDAIILKLSSKSEVDQQLAIEWIKRYRKRYPLFQDQLDILNKNLMKMSIDLQKEVVPIIFECIIDKKIRPSNEKLLLEGLRDILTHYPKNNTEYKDLRRKVIYLLGHFDDEMVITQLISDTKDGSISEFGAHYEEPRTAAIIQKNELKLFNLQSDMIKRNKQESAQKISEILDKIQPFYDIPVKMLTTDELIKKIIEVNSQKERKP